MHFGPLGAASAWLMLNLGYVLIEIPIMHTKLLKREIWHWYRNDVAIPVSAGLVIAGIGRILFVRSAPQPLWVLQLAVVAILTVGITLLSLPTLRSMIDRTILKTD